MATPAENLARSLEVLKVLQDDDVVAIHTSSMTRVHRERLLENGFIQEVIKGWYIAGNPQDRQGDSTPWYTAFWQFCGQYLDYRFGNAWSVSPEQSISLHTGNQAVPTQLLVRSEKAGNNLTKLMHGTSLLDVAGAPAEGKAQEVINGVRVYSLPSALAECGPAFYQQNPIDARGALFSIADASQILPFLLEDGRSWVAGRLAGAFRNIGRDDLADEIIGTFKDLKYQITEVDPFETPSPILSSGRQESAYVSRLKLMWLEMREDVINHFPEAPGIPADQAAYLDRVDELFVTDAYHSLSIEGYKVSTELIEKVRNGDWNPDDNEGDREHRNAMAARGYWEAFNAVKDSIEKIFSGEDPGRTVKTDHGRWYRSLFAPSVTAGIIEPAELAGYRNMPVFIRGSMHTPMSSDAVRDAIPTLFELLTDEASPAVRAVLGHFLFVYIHPYMDGNGRTGRFLMNAMFASGGYEWTVLPVERRADYMAALEQASVNMDIKPFAAFVSEFVTIKQMPDDGESAGPR